MAYISFTSMHTVRLGKLRNFCQQGDKPTRYGTRWEHNIKMDSSSCPVAGFYEQVKDALGSIKCREFLH
jgi:hypothetical protein